MGEIKERDCTTCLYEYTCNWDPAGDKVGCEEWKGDSNEGMGIN